MSTKKDLYLAVKAAILDKTNIKHFKLFNSQFDNMDAEDTFPFPCCFLEFIDVNWLTKSKGYQEGDLKIRLHIGWESLKTEDLDIFDTIEAIHAELQGKHDPERYTPLDRAFEGQDTNHDNVVVWIVDYDTLLSDNSGNRDNKLVLTQIETLEIIKDNTTDATAPRLKELP